MSCEQDSKKRKRDGRDGVSLSSPSAGNGAALAPEPSMAEMKAMLDETREQMQRMQSEINGMKSCRGQRSSNRNGALSPSMARRVQRDVESQLSCIGELERKCRELEDKNKLLQSRHEVLEAKCDSLERSLQLLLKHQGWEYSACPIPSSHWIDQDFDEDYAYCMTSLVLQLKQEAVALRRGVDLTNISVCQTPYVATLLHDDALLPHWKELSDALQLYPYSLLDPEQSRNFAICGLQLTPAVLDMLMPSLTMKDFRALELDGNEFVNARDGIFFAVGFIKNNPRLEEFVWINNDLGSMDNANHLLGALCSLLSIRRIHLQNSCGENVNGYDILRSLVSSNAQLKDIDLSSNNIWTMGGTHLSDYLATNPPLEELSLEDNHFDDNDVTLIAQALKQNTNLKSLSLKRNAITDMGRNELHNTLFDASTLNSVADSNHTCLISGVGFGIYDVTTNLAFNSKDSREAKIYSLLSSRHKEETNCYHLDRELGNRKKDGCSLKLAPHVLQRVYLSSEIGYRECRKQEASKNFDSELLGGTVQKNNPVTSLSIMFEILRSWKMPEMYEHLGTSS